MMLRNHDSEAGHLRRNAPKFHDIARHDGGSDLPRGERDQHIVEWTQAIAHSRCIPIEGSEDPSGMIHERWSETEHASGMKCLLESVNCSLALRCVCAEA